MGRSGVVSARGLPRTWPPRPGCRPCVQRFFMVGPFVSSRSCAQVASGQRAFAARSRRPPAGADGFDVRSRARRNRLRLHARSRTAPLWWLGPAWSRARRSHGVQGRRPSMSHHGRREVRRRRRPGRAPIRLALGPPRSSWMPARLAGRPISGLWTCARDEAGVQLDAGLQRPPCLGASSGVRPAARAGWPVRGGAAASAGAGARGWSVVRARHDQRAGLQAWQSSRDQPQRRQLETAARACHCQARRARGRRDRRRTTPPMARDATVAAVGRARRQNGPAGSPREVPRWSRCRRWRASATRTRRPGRVGPRGPTRRHEDVASATVTAPSPDARL